MINTRFADDYLRSIARKAERIDLVAVPPSTVREATETRTMGYRLAIKVSLPQDADGGRKITIAGIDDGMVVRAGNPAYWVLTGGGEILAVGPVGESKALRTGLAWTMPDTDIIVTEA